LPFDIPPEVTEEKLLQVGVIVSAEQQLQEDRPWYPGIDDAMDMSMAQLHRPSPPPPGMPLSQATLATPPWPRRTPRREEAWDLWADSQLVSVS
jgi:hypothetical protein